MFEGPTVSRKFSQIAEVSGAVESRELGAVLDKACLAGLNVGHLLMLGGPGYHGCFHHFGPDMCGSWYFRFILSAPDCWKLPYAGFSLVFSNPIVRALSRVRRLLLV